MGTNNQNYWTTGEWVEWAKSNLDIDKPNPDLTDDEIKQVLRLLSDLTPDPVIGTDGKFHINTDGVHVMLLVMLSKFPAFYQKFELSHQN